MSELKLPIESLLIGASEAHERIKVKITSDNPDVSIYVDVATFLNCVVQIGELITKLSPDKDTRRTFDKLKRESQNARDYYHHIHDRAPKSIEKNELLLGILQLVEPISGGGYGLKLQIIGSPTKTLNIRQHTPEGERWLTLYLEIDERRINLTAINAAMENFRANMDKQLLNQINSKEKEAR